MSEFKLLTLNAKHNVLFWKFQWRVGGCARLASPGICAVGAHLESGFALNLKRSASPARSSHLHCVINRTRTGPLPDTLSFILHTSLAGGETWQQSAEWRLRDWNWSATAELAQEREWISSEFPPRTCAVFHRGHRLYLQLHRRDGLWGCGGRRAMALSSEYEWLLGARCFDSGYESVLYGWRWLCSPNVLLLLSSVFLSCLSHALNKWVEKSQSSTSILKVPQDDWGEMLKREKFTKSTIKVMYFLPITCSENTDMHSLIFHYGTFLWFHHWIQLFRLY